MDDHGPETLALKDIPTEPSSPYRAPYQSPSLEVSDASKIFDKGRFYYLKGLSIAPGLCIDKMHDDRQV
jgi:hypothetical protein